MSPRRAQDLAPIERMSRLGLSLRRLAERNEGAFHVFVQRRLEAMQVGRPGDASCQAPAPEPATDLAAAGPTEDRCQRSGGAECCAGGA